MDSQLKELFSLKIWWLIVVVVFGAIIIEILFNKLFRWWKKRNIKTKK